MNKRSTLLLLVMAFVASLTPPASLLAGPPEEKKRAVERLGEQVSRGIIQEGLETLDTAANRARLARILNSPEMRGAVHDLTASLVLGVIDGVAEARARGGSSEDTSKAIGKGIDRHLTPALGRMAGRMIGGALDAALTDARISRVEVLGERGTRAAILGLARGLEDDLGPALAATIDKDLGPALALVIERDILPSIGRGLDTPEMQQVVANLTRSFATEFIAGAGDAIDVKTESNKAEGKESGLQLFGDKVAIGYTVAMFVSFALGTMIIVLTVILFRNSRRLRKQSEAAAQREATLLNLIDSLESDRPELKADLRNLLEEQLDT